MGYTLTRYSLMLPRTTDVVKLASQDLPAFANSIAAAIGQGIDEARNLAKTDATQAISSAMTTLRGEASFGLAVVRAEFQRADTALSARLDSESSTRLAADQDLGGRITSEASARAAGDASLRQELTADLQEQADAADADLDALRRDMNAAGSALSARIDTEAKDRATGDAANAAMVASEATTRAAKDAELRDLIATYAPMLSWWRTASAAARDGQVLAWDASTNAWRPMTTQGTSTLWVVDNLDGTISLGGSAVVEEPAGSGMYVISGTAVTTDAAGVATITA